MTTDLATATTAIAERLGRAWNAGDGHAFGALFADDADFVDIRGDHHAGRPAIAHGHEAILGSIYAGSTVTYEVEDVRPIGSSTAVAVLGATLDAPTGPLAGTNRSRITAVLEAAGDGWVIAAFHNTLRLDDPTSR